MRTATSRADGSSIGTTTEYSRDCEPMAVGHTDSYYYRLAHWVRRFKGVRPRPAAKGLSAVAVDGRFTDGDPVSGVDRTRPA